MALEGPPRGDIHPGSEGKPGVAKRPALGRKGTHYRRLQLRVNLPLGCGSSQCAWDTASEEGSRQKGPPLGLCSLAASEPHRGWPGSPFQHLLQRTPPPTPSSDRNSFHPLSLRSSSPRSLSGSRPPACFPPPWLRGSTDRDEALWDHPPDPDAQEPRGQPLSFLCPVSL